jgi:chromosome segregation ATPase
MKDRRTKRELAEALVFVTAEQARTLAQRSIAEEALRIKHAEIDSVHSSLKTCREAKENVLAMLQTEQHQARALQARLDAEKALTAELEATIRRRDETITELRHERDVSTRATQALSEFIAEGGCRFLS